MAGANQRQTYDKRVNTSEGHYVRWEIAVRDLHLLRSWHFKKKLYQTFCGTSPSSWGFKLWFPEVREDGTASMSVTVTRKDSLDVQLDATVWVELGDPMQVPIFPKQSFTKGGMGPGSEMQETVDLEPYPGMEGAVHDCLVVIVTLTVSSCHSSD